ncbi:Carboxylesterase type B [Acidovorax delafieldii 2AN]|uniref:Carboxylic ester hydrolase n=2 Tax=Acidovorax delafieldii TaxID=47920 RepID=C5T136_ACIDE|nr:Carboxylesterase type B [Acidovorax delafieldii 2AN]
MVAGCLALGVSHAQATAPLTATVQTDSGPVRGTERDDILAWRGIPYATAPVGELRWRPPQPPKAWTTPRDASVYGNFCPQNAELGVFGQAGGSEDCLNLNVFVSRQAAQGGQKLPVFVWIHGGSLWVGAARDYDPSWLAIQGKAVVVTLNYRLGLLGFFAHPALRAEDGATSNYGFMDQQLALDWVQRNIAAFGGDPDNVTISGESSGGGSVLAHMVSPGSAGKFQHAVAMSGAAVALRFPAFGAPKPLEWAERQGRAFAQTTGCDQQGDVAIAACLRQLPAETVLASQGPYLLNQLVLDGKVMPMHPGDAFRSGQFNHATFINGTTRDEGGFFVGLAEDLSGQPMDDSTYAATMRLYFGSRVNAVMQEYPADRFATRSDAAAAAITDMLFACPARAINRWTSVHVPTFAFEFSDRTAPSYLKPVSFAMGAAHTLELAYLFPSFHGGAGRPVQLNSQQLRLAEKMVNVWTTAAKAGEREALWRYEPTRDNFLNLSLPQTHVTNGFGKDHHCDFWDQSSFY